MIDKTEENSFEENLKETSSFFKTPIGIFAAKTIIILMVIYFITPDLSGLKKLETEQNKYIALGFIQNPRVLLDLSEYHEKKGKFEKAIRDVTLAIGLLELHNANKETMSFYTKRLEYLKKINSTLS